MYVTAKITEFVNGFNSVTYFSEDTVLWMIFISLMGFFMAAVYLVKND